MIRVASQVDLVGHERRRGVETVVERVPGEHFVGRAVLMTIVVPSRPGDVHAAARRNRRGEDVRYALEPLQLIVRLSGLRVDTPTGRRSWSSGNRGCLVEQRRRHVWRVVIEPPAMRWLYR